MSPPRPFRVQVPDEVLEGIRVKVAAYPWHEMPDDGGWDYGTNLDYMKELCAWWLDSFDWRAQEERLNRCAHFKAPVDGIDIHYIHEKGSGPAPLPLIISHGWPGSVVEFLDIIEPLAHPERFGGSADDAFDVVAPSLPGFGFSGRPRRPMGPRAMAGLFNTLMTRVLGYDGYLAQGGDWGGAISSFLGLDHAPACLGIHINIMTMRHCEGPKGPEEEAWARRFVREQEMEDGYRTQQGTRPQTLSYAMMDSPVGVAAWIVEKFRSWSDLGGGDLESVHDRDTLLANIMVYLVTRTFNTASWIYYGRREEGGRVLSPEGRRVEVPCAAALFPAELLSWPPRSYVERMYNITRWTEMPRGGHFAALEQPDLLVEDIRAFARTLRCQGPAAGAPLYHARRTETERGAGMNFEYSDRAKEVRDAVAEFMEAHVYPNEEAMLAQIEEGERFAPIPLLESLKQKAKAADLWNLFLPESEHGAGLSNLEYAPACEEMGRSAFAPEVFNCSAPDTGNMEVFVRYGTEAQKEEWLTPLLAGEIRSAFAMTEPDAASSDATNVAIRIEREGDNYVINGRKWWTSGALDPRCRILIVMGKTDPDNESRYRQQSMILVPMPWPGLTVKRMLPVFGFDDAPHGHAELVFEDVRVPVSNILLGEGRGFEIAQGRLGPGRIHHCMRAIGAAERALERVCRRARMRTTFGVSLADHGVTRERIADMRIEIEQARLLTLKAAYMMDTVGNKAARREIAMIKVAAPNMACRVLDMAIQAFGAAGVTSDYGLAAAYAHARTLRLADGPDEVHRNQIARLELRQYDNTVSTRGGNAFVTQWDELSDEFESRPRFVV